MKEKQSLQSQNQPSVQTPQLPYRFREEQFRRYEPFIADAIAKYPGPIIINPGLLGLNTVTFACRFRDACQSYLKHNWPSRLINREEFLLNFPNIGVAESHSLGTVRIGERKLLRSGQLMPIVPHVSNATLGVNPQHLTITTDEQFELICRLASMRLLTSEVTISGPAVTLENKNIYDQQYDVSIEFTADLRQASVI